MSHLQYFNYAGFGERANKNSHYSQAVRVDNRIEISGQGGWDRATDAIPSNRLEEIDMTFANIEHALQQAGGTGFDQVYKLRIYLAKYEDGEVEGRLVENLRKAFTKHQPLMTVIGVDRLYGKMTIEIEAEAHVKA